MTFDPFALQFYVNTYWHARDDDVGSIGRALTRYLALLAQVDPNLANWRLGNAWEETPSTESDMTSLIERSVNYNEEGLANAKDGYNIQALSNSKEQRFAILGTAGRIYDWPLSNGFCIDTDNDGPADMSVVTYALMKAVVLATSAAWRPDFCAAYSTDLEPDCAEGRWRSAWMTYVPPAEAAGIDLVGVPFSEWTPDGGLLLSATEDTFDAANPAHVAGARRLHEATRHLNPPADLEGWDDDEDLPGETID